MPHPRVLMVTAALLALGGCVTSGSPQTAEVCPTLDADLQRILDDSAAANGVLGAQAAVLVPGRAPWVGVMGRNGPADPMRPELLIGTGSISKMYAAVAAMRLIDQGAIALTDTLGRWFPATANVNPSIPLLRLLQQTSGIADYMAAPGYFATVMADPNRSWQPDELLPLIGPPLFAPGTAWNASNSNSLLLHIIVSRETGRSLGDFMRRELYPGRTQTWLAGDGPAPGPLATQWASDAQGRLFDYSAMFFGPALFTSRNEVQASALDLADFARRLFGGNLLSARMRAAMLTVVPDDGGIAGQTGGGLGIRRYQMIGRTLYGHSGGTPNSTALVLFDPATRVVAAMSINQGGSSHGNSHFRTTPALLQAGIACAGS